MSVYGTYGGLPGWVIDKIFTSTTEMAADTSVLAGRYAVVKQDTTVALYQKTPGTTGDPAGWTVIFDTINAPNIAAGTISYEGESDTIVYDASSGTMDFYFPSLKKVHDASESLTIEAAPLYFENNILYNKGLNQPAQTGVTIETSGGIKTSTNNAQHLKIGTYWTILT